MLVNLKSLFRKKASVFSQRKTEIFLLILEKKINDFRSFYKEYLFPKSLYAGDNNSEIWISWVAEVFAARSFSSYRPILIIPFEEDEASRIIDEYTELIDTLTERKLIRIVPSPPIPKTAARFHVRGPYGVVSPEPWVVISDEMFRRLCVHFDTEFIAYADAMKKFKDIGYKTDEEEKYEAERSWIRRWLPLAISVIALAISLWGLLKPKDTIQAKPAPVPKSQEK
jgi:hypothetical protein